MTTGSARKQPRAVIFGLAGAELSAAERAFFAATDPFGFILFARNCADRPQIQALVADLRRTVGRTDAPILIDQEGGRVQRLAPPAWRAAPPAAVFGALAARDERAALEAAWLNARMIAADLADLGITVNCAPVLDIPAVDADPIIGDRAFAADPAVAALLGHAVCSGFLDGAVAPVIKHIPGHGRATADSHLALPVVDAPRIALDATDFAPFSALRDMPWAMTAHVVYAAIDPHAPASTSAMVVSEIIRGRIGFDGVLVSDDLCMAALSGSPGDRARACLAAGCDVVLHCNGDLAEMIAVADACPPLTDAALVRINRAEARRLAGGSPLDPGAGDRLARLLAAEGAAG